MLVRIKKTVRYADPRGPHMPQISLIEGETVDVSDELAESIIRNKHGSSVKERHLSSTVVPESKDEGVIVDSKDEQSSEESTDEHGSANGEGNASEAYDALSPKKQKFVDEYDGDATAAAIAAGYAESNAENQGAKLLTDDSVQAAIAEKGEQ